MNETTQTAQTEDDLTEREVLAFEGALQIFTAAAPRLSGHPVTEFEAIHNATKAAIGVGDVIVNVPNPKPAVPINKSVTPDFIVCLEDGKKFKSLKRHLRTHYNLTPEQYREKWGLPATYPMVCANYSAVRSQLAKDNGLGTK